MWYQRILIMPLFDAASFSWGSPLAYPRVRASSLAKSLYKMSLDSSKMFGFHGRIGSFVSPSMGAPSVYLTVADFPTKLGLGREIPP